VVSAGTRGWRVPPGVLALAHNVGLLRAVLISLAPTGESLTVRAVQAKNTCDALLDRQGGSTPRAELVS